MLLRQLLETSRFGGNLFNIDISKDHFFWGILSVVHFLLVCFTLNQYTLKIKKTKLAVLENEIENLPEFKIFQL